MRICFIQKKALSNIFKKGFLNILIRSKDVVSILLEKFNETVRAVFLIISHITIDTVHIIY
jgi:hypothetical protein